MKYYAYDIVAAFGLVLAAVGVGIQFGYTWGMIMAGCLLLILSVSLSILANVTRTN